ncbi:cold-shock protein [Rhodospirillum rubrum]|uniref:cold shock domain-containing protein n=1 Tax=Rhodospirillum rubrum TaxID=1085 RepID=UPI001904E9F2|nr:cold shock domain-containing protein [Rhodospirillum rubrum]MBK1665584.1 cold-shock protein [Rhodospirillum rubrum]MBK1677696.1 cold-shock protein [Rhodospirillum rubrum]
MLTGTITWFDTINGYGFIRPDDGGGDIAVDMPALDRSGLRSLRDGQRVAYRLTRPRFGGVMAGMIRMA